MQAIYNKNVFLSYLLAKFLNLQSFRRKYDKVSIQSMKPLFEDLLDHSARLFVEVWRFFRVGLGE